jgi:hypothetical protein
MNSNWRQVRIFTSDFTDQWYFGLLAAFAVPFATRFPKTPFWFTRYTGDRNNPKDDIEDTEIAKLEAPYLNANQEHRSLRFRFCPASDEEAFLEALFTATFWYSGFLSFNILTQFGGSRFCPATDIAARERRAKIVGRLLYAHSLFVLDAFNGTDAFEEF